jgi:hypothetical protein
MFSSEQLFTVKGGKTSFFQIIASQVGVMKFSK